MRRLEQHLELPLSRPPNAAEVPIDLVRRQHNAHAAFALACQASGLEDKEIYLPLSIDAGTFSRIKKGEASLQADKEAAFCQVVGNTIYPEWRAYQLGCTMVLIKSEAERRAEAAEHALIEERAKTRLLSDLLKGRAVA